LAILESISKIEPVYDNFLHFPDNEKDCIEVWWGDPSVWSWSNKSAYKVGYALSESESLKRDGREKALENLKRCDLLLCPSEYSSRAYKESPIDVPIRIVPLGYNPDVYTWYARDWSRELKVLLAGSAQMRKGTDLGIEGFLRAFGKRKRFSLTVWSSVKTPMREQLKLEYGKAENVTFDDTEYENPMSVYSRHHILLHPHLSGGFELIPIEAMASGMCAMVSRVSSPMEYFNKDIGYWIEMSENYVPVRACLSDTAGFWRVPDVDNISETLKYIAKNMDTAKAKGEYASRYIQKYTWENTVKKLIQVIKEESDVGF